MKRFVMFTLTTLLIGCSGGGSDGGDGGRVNPKPGPQPPRGELMWGDLACQKARSCEDTILNKSWKDLIAFFKFNFEKVQARGANDTQDLLIYRCGVRTQKLWLEYFRESLGETEFFDRTLSWEACTYASNLEEQIMNYFKNTGEYKNETK